MLLNPICSYAQIPGTRQEHCIVTYNNTIYLFGGFKNSTSQSLDPNFFFSATLPFTTDAISWTPLDTKNATSVADPECIVEPSLGYLLIIGGVKDVSDFSSNPGIQVYNFKKQLWNEPNLLQRFPQEFLAPIYRPRATLIDSGVIFIWATSYKEKKADSFIYNLTLTIDEPWQWTPIIINNTKLNVTCSPGIASSKGNAFIFGGLTRELTGFEPHREMYIYNPKHGFMLPNINVPTSIGDAIVGILANKIHIIILDDGDVTAYKPIMTVEFDLKTFEMSRVKVPKKFTLNRRRAAATSIFGSDVILIHGGIVGPLGHNTTGDMIAYNMTSGKWSTKINIIDPPRQYDSFDLPKINGLDLNDDPSNTKTDSDRDLSTGALIGIIFGSVTVFTIMTVLLIRIWMEKRHQLRLTELAEIINNNDLAARENAKSKPVITFVKNEHGLYFSAASENL
ncbi:8497_t:CDS:2 [Ambispora leptoticha]|uniref:8497_t:CDS:1 n=1 Tax=Ambispora leptoticha TaxID=144679 RepID=A0A9N9FF21_9GLOM|nr:8497_t:CDS:2 [Ambispora leptoticha]